MPTLSRAHWLTSSAAVFFVVSGTTLAGSAAFADAMAADADGARSSTAGTGPAAQLAAKLGKPARLLIGIGAQGATVDPISAIESEAAKVDIYERYLGGGDWTQWNSPPCNYVCVVADAAEKVGAVPMYTQYQMANDGDGNLEVLHNKSFMSTYWARVKLMFQTIDETQKPALVNFEPDFWGYVEQQAPDGNPAKMAAMVSINEDCAKLPNDVTGVAKCLIKMGRKYAPKAYVGFPPSNWGGRSTAEVVAFMKSIGAQNADFIVEQTSDRDAGCYEKSPQPAYCTRGGSGWYWDETNETHPNFNDNLTEAAAYHSGIGGLPVIWWQTPEGVPSSSKGGRDYHYRDNRMNYYLTHPAELVKAGGLAIVFSTGEDHQTNITTDGGQFQLLDSNYFAAPAKLP